MRTTQKLQWRLSRKPQPKTMEMDIVTFAGTVFAIIVLAWLFLSHPPK